MFNVKINLPVTKKKKKNGRIYRKLFYRTHISSLAHGNFNFWSYIPIVSELKPELISVYTIKLFLI